MANGNHDDEYKDAVQPIVDDHMRTDRLGPHFCRVLKEHKPASDAIVALVAEEVIKDPKVKSAVKVVIDERNRENKMRYVNVAIGAFGTILIGLITWGVQYLISHAR